MPLDCKKFATSDSGHYTSWRSGVAIRYPDRGSVQFKLSHLLIAVTIVAATLAVSPALTVLLAVILLMTLVLNLIVPQSRFHDVSEGENSERHQFLAPTIGLYICFAFFLFSIGLPIIQEWIYLFSGWYFQLWLVPQLLCYIASLALLSFVRFDSHDRYEYRVIVTILYIVFIPVVIVGVFIWDVLSTDVPIL